MISTFDLIIHDKNSIDLEEIVFSAENQAILEQVVKEHKHIEALQKYGLQVDNKILLYGHSGCGKTTTAKALAKALGRSIFILNLTNFVSSRIGDTGKNLKAVFDKAGRDKAVLFLDEFDQIGKMRGDDDKDVGEMRRLVNTLIQQIDYFPEGAILMAATNYPDLIDVALKRRFQLKLKFEMPEKEQLDAYYEQLLSVFPNELRKIERKYGISYAEAKDYVHTSIKSKLISQWEKEENMENVEDNQEIGIITSKKPKLTSKKWKITNKKCKRTSEKRKVTSIK